MYMVDLKTVRVFKIALIMLELESILGAQSSPLIGVSVKFLGEGGGW